MEAWDQLAEVAEEQLKGRVESVLNTHANLGNLGEIEFMKGEISGIKLFMKLPEIVIESAKADLKERYGEDFEEEV